MVAARDLLYTLYERRLRHQLAGRELPRHVGIIGDGNRRWARAVGMGDVSDGHRRGADKFEDVLRWCAVVYAAAGRRRAGTRCGDGSRLALTEP